MKDAWVKLGCFLTGWNYQILKSCTESSRKRLKKYISAILILIILWAFVGYSFSARYIGTQWWGSAIAALIFVTIIVQIERQIILTLGKSWWLAFLRVLIALIMAVIGSVIIDQIIFKEDIEKKMLEIVDRQVQDQLPGRLITIDTKLGELQAEIDSLNAKNMELYNDIAEKPTIQTVATARIPMTIKTVDGRDSIVYTTTVSRNPIPNPKSRETEVNNQNLEKLREEQEAYIQRKLDAERQLRDDLKAKQGFLEELNALLEILAERPVALLFYVVLFAFLMFLELFVVISKVLDKSSDYDMVVEYQLSQKIKTLNELVKG